MEPPARAPRPTPVPSGPVAPRPVFPAAVKVSPQRTYADTQWAQPTPLMWIRFFTGGDVVPPLHVREQVGVHNMQAFPRFSGPQPLLPAPQGGGEAGVMGTGATATAGRSFMPPTRDSGPGELLPVESGDLGGLPLAQVGKGGVAPGAGMADPRGATTHSDPPST